MASYTEHLNLLKKDPVADGADTFNVQTMLNENWDKVDEAVSRKAELGADGKIPAEQLPEMDYIPTAEKGAAGGVAVLDKDGKIAGGQFPAAGLPPAAHGASHGKAGADPVTPGDIGAAVAPSPVAATFAVAGWVRNAATSCYEQTVSCPELLASDDKRTTVSPVGSTDAAAQKLTDAAEALVDRYACTVNGKLYARCPEKAPTVAFQVAVTIVRG